MGFEPTAPFGVTGFQDRLLKPLGHLSKCCLNSITKLCNLVNDFFSTFFNFKISIFFCDIFSFCHFAQSCCVVFVHIYHFCVSQKDCLTPAFFSYSPPFLCNHSNFFIKQFSRCVITKYFSRIMIYPVFNIGYILG